MHSCRILLVANLVVFGCFLFDVNSAEVELPNYRMCVPHQLMDVCKNVTGNPSAAATIECVGARDRMECLQLVEQRRADFVAVDPEDMHVALNMRNEDFAVFSEIRTREEQQSAFRYLGILLVHRSSNIDSLASLKGRKSCHTGFGRNVGYKIPITKLRNAGVLRLADDPAMSYVEKELQALSELFTESCLVGKYSPNAEVNAALKKRFANLCARCEDPIKCDYPDKYSGYDGAIRCLVENGGDVAFTKVIFVNRYFGLPVGGNAPTTNASANPADYEYLCDDGSRRPVAGPEPPCTWAQRPWQAYMGNADVRPRAEPLQRKIAAFYTEAQTAAGQNPELKRQAARMWIDERNVVVPKAEHSLPGAHLEAAQYRDVIERNGNAQLKIRLCVRTDVEQRKCDLLRRVAFSRDIRPEFECAQPSAGGCTQAVRDGQADAVVVAAKYFGRARAHNLMPIVHEKLDARKSYVAVVAKSVTDPLKDTTPIAFDASNPRSLDVALLLRHHAQCPSQLANTPTPDAVRIMRSEQLPLLSDASAFELICPDGRRQPVDAVETCNFNRLLGTNAVFVRADLSETAADAYAHGFVSLSDQFGGGARLEEVFELFGEFEAGSRDVLFGDDTEAFVANGNVVGEHGGDERAYQKMHCVDE